MQPNVVAVNEYEATNNGVKYLQGRRSRGDKGPILPTCKSGG